MKVLEKGNKTIFEIEYTCGSKDYDKHGCGAKLLISKDDLYRYTRYFIDDSSESYIAFTCPLCESKTNVDKNKIPFVIQDNIEDIEIFMKKQKAKNLVATGDALKTIRNWPKEGVDFLDINPILNDPQLFKACIDIMSEYINENQYTKIVALDARGFIFGSALAYKHNLGLVMARKKGKLPPETESCKYDLEYGSAELEISVDSISKDDRVLIIDDILATGGTAKATIDLVLKLGAKKVDALFLIEIEGLDEKKRLGNIDSKALIKR